MKSSHQQHCSRFLFESRLGMSWYAIGCRIIQCAQKGTGLQSNTTILWNFVGDIIALYVLKAPSLDFTGHFESIVWLSKCHMVVLNFFFDQTKYTQRLETISETSLVFTCLFLPAMVYEWYENTAAWMTIRYNKDISERNWLPRSP